MNDPAKLLAPDRMPGRDDDGYVTHPDLDLLLADPPDGVDPEDAELYIDGSKIAAAGYEAGYATMDGQLDVSHPAYQRYFDLGERNCCGWVPAPPKGDGWRLVGIYETEDGPAAMFVRDLAGASA